MRSKLAISKGRSKLLPHSNKIAHQVHMLLGSQAPHKQGKAVPSVKILTGCEFCEWL